MTAFVVYTRRGCHLCEVLIEKLTEEVREAVPIELRDIDTNPDWRNAYDTRVPVLTYDDEWVCDYHLDVERVRSILAASSSLGQR